LQFGQFLVRDEQDVGLNAIYGVFGTCSRLMVEIVEFLAVRGNNETDFFRVLKNLKFTCLDNPGKEICKKPNHSRKSP
jgi:hypothetical protein